MLMRNVFVNVFKSDAAVWWAAIFCTSSSMFDKLLHLSKSKSFAMSCLRSCNFCEAVGNLLTVTMYLQDTFSRLHCPSLHKIDFRVHVASALTRTLALHKSKSCSAVSAQHNHSRRAIAQFAPLDSRSDTLASSPNQHHQLGFTRTQTNHVLLLGRRVHGIPRIFNRTFDPNCNSRTAATVFDVSSPISIGHHHDQTLQNARNTRNVMIATNDHVAGRISNQIPQQTLDVHFITIGSCAHVSG